MAAFVLTNTRWEWKTQLYVEQERNEWPSEGKHILAQYDDEGVVVYQAYCPEIAEYATKNQRFGGEKFSFSRMSWIKTNFLWMMYRCGWATKPGQERVLAVRISHDGFSTILSQALTGADEKERGLKEKSDIRLQWDPDHLPNGESHKRRAIQLGLRNKVVVTFLKLVVITNRRPPQFSMNRKLLFNVKEVVRLCETIAMLERYANEWIMEIKDITPFITEQYKVVQSGKLDDLLVAKERVYPVNDDDVVKQLRLDALATTLHRQQ